MSFSPSFIIIHHSATDVDASVENIKAVHISRGMTDIAYHFLINQSGAIIPGRSMTIPGEHAKGINSESIGICCIGDFSSRPPRPAMLESLITLVTQLRTRFNIPGEKTIGHRDVVSLVSTATQTVCPGDALENFLPYIRERSENNLELPIASLKRDAPYDVSCDSCSHKWINEWTLECKAILHNTGAIDWDNRNSETSVVDITLLITGENNFSLSSKIDLAQKIVRPGESAALSVNHDFSLLGPGDFNLAIKLKFNHSPDEIHHFQVGKIKAPRSGNPDDLRYSCKVSNISVEKKQGFLLLVRGHVKNLGLLPWTNSIDTAQRPFRVGLIAYHKTDETSEIIDEFRYELPHNSIQPDEEFPFQFEINSFGLPHGEVSLVISMVKEQDFWFHQKGSTPGIQTIQIESPQIRREKVTHKYELVSYKNPAKILYIGPTLPLFDRDTGNRRIFTILNMFRESGIDITVAYESAGVFDNSSTYIDALKKNGITVVQGPLNFLASCRDGDFSICILGWYKCASRYLDIIRQVLPRSKVIVDSVDIHWIREKRGVDAKELLLSSVELEKNKLEERTVYERADEVWAVSEEDRLAILEEIPDCSTKIISLLTEPQFCVQSQNANDILFIGSFNHPPNKSAALWGYEIVEAFRKKTGLRCTYFIVGGNPPEEIMRLHDGVNTIVTGFVEDLSPYYQRSKVFLAPIRYGAGVKGKITDAAAHGLPILTTAIGNEGILLHHRTEGWVCETTGEFVDSLIEAFNSDTNLASIATEGKNRVMQMTGKDAARKPLELSVRSAPVVISIVTWNKCELLQQCLLSILDLTEFPDWRIAVVSNGCTDGTIELVNGLQKKYPSRIDLHINEQNDFFVLPNNKIIREYNDADIVLLNNDTEILDQRWLVELQNAAYTSPITGAAGCLIIDNNEAVSEAGGRITHTGDGINLGRGKDRKSPEIMRFRYVGFVSGCCLYMRRDMITRFGVLDEDLHPMYYEDVEWQYRLHTFGIKTIYTPRTVVKHLEGSSSGTDTQQGMKRFQIINRDKFVKKYQNLDLDALSR